MHLDEWVALMDAVPENPVCDPTVDDLADQWEQSFRVAVPVTGGMDSSTLWLMACEAGVPAVPVYVDCGQDYATLEIDAASRLVGRRPTVLDAPLPAGRWAHIIPRRNLTVIVEIAEWMRTNGWWGEVWFGNLAGESPAVRGDKSSAFFAGLAEHLVKDGPACDVFVVHPLRGLDKTDLVRWWQARGLAGRLLHDTKSCFDADRLACGACQACFRKAAAFLAAGWDIQDVQAAFGGWDFGPYVQKYRSVMSQAVQSCDWTRYSPARCRDTLAAIDVMETR